MGIESSRSHAAGYPSILHVEGIRVGVGIGVGCFLFRSIHIHIKHMEYGVGLSVTWGINHTGQAKSIMWGNLTYLVSLSISTSTSAKPPRIDIDIERFDSLHFAWRTGGRRRVRVCQGRALVGWLVGWGETGREVVCLFVCGDVDLRNTS